MTGHRVFLILMSIAILGIGGLGWLLGISPMLTAATSANSDVAAVEAENALHEAKVVTLKAQFEALPETRKKLKRVQLVMPDRQYLDLVVNELTQIAAASSVVISAVSASEGAVYTPTTAPATTSTPAPTDGATAAPVDTAPVLPAPGNPEVESHLYTLPILITLVGTHDNIMAFVNACQLGQRLFVIDSVNLTAGTAAPASQASVAGFVFVYRDPAAIIYSQPEPTETSTPAPTPSETPTPEPTP